MVDAVRVEVDHHLCEAYANCQRTAPEVFKVRDHDLSHVLLEEVPKDLEGKVERAIGLRPVQRSVGFPRHSLPVRSPRGAAHTGRVQQALDAGPRARTTGPTVPRSPLPVDGGHRLFRTDLPPR